MKNRNEAPFDLNVRSHSTADMGPSAVGCRALCIWLGERDP